MKIKGDVYCVKKPHMAGYLLMQGFTLMRIPPDEKNPKLKVYIFANAPELENVVDQYFKKYCNN